MNRTLTFAVLILVMFTVAEALPAQSVVLGGGINVGTVPRALEPLCGSARRLKGVGLTGRAGLDASRFRVAATVDYVGRIGVRDAAGCVARSGIAVDSAFAQAENSALNVNVGVSVLVGPVFRVGAEIGRVLDHSSWFAGPTVGVQYRKLQLELAARRHIIEFDEITREYASGTTRELSRRPGSEISWGAVTRVLLIAH